MTEQQPYEVVGTYDGFELRSYPAHVVAEVSVRGSFESAGNAAFRPLFNYISGSNDSGQSIAMTAPVVMRSEGDEHAVAFVLPASMSSEAAPAPTNPSVSIAELPATLSAAVRYSGRWSQSSYDRHLADLLAALERAGLVPVSAPRFARYDPPFKPWFLRRNEIVIDVQGPER